MKVRTYQNFVDDFYKTLQFVLLQLSSYLTEDLQKVHNELDDITVLKIIDNVANSPDKELSYFKNQFTLKITFSTNVEKFSVKVYLTNVLPQKEIDTIFHFLENSYDYYVPFRIGTNEVELRSISNPVPDLYDL